MISKGSWNRKWEERGKKECYLIPQPQKLTFWPRFRGSKGEVKAIQSIDWGQQTYTQRCCRRAEGSKTIHLLQPLPRALATCTLQILQSLCPQQNIIALRLLFSHKGRDKGQVSYVLGVFVKKPRSSVRQEFIGEFLTNKEPLERFASLFCCGHNDCMKGANVTD